MTGGFTADVGEIAGVPGFVVVRSRFGGPAQLVVDSNSVAGSWSFAGTGTTRGWFAFGGSGSDLRVDTTYDGSGTFTGTKDAASMVGTVNTTGSATFSGVTVASSDTDSVAEPLTDAWVDCGRLYARFDRQIAAEIEQFPGLEEQLVGVLYLRDGGIDEESLEEAAALSAEAATLAAAAEQLAQLETLPIPEGLLAGNEATSLVDDILNSATDADAGLIRPDVARQLVEEMLPSHVAPAVEELARTSPRWILERAVEILDRVERLEAVLAGDCPPDEQFRNLLSDASATIVTTLLDLVDKNQLDPALLPLIVRLAAGTGLTTSSPPDVDSGDGLIGPRVAEAVVRHALGHDGSNSGATASDGSSGDGAISQSGASDASSGDGLISQSAASDLTAMAVQIQSD